MNEENQIHSQEDKLISQAKKRLVGACVILFILLISAPFILKNRNEEGPTEPIKIIMESTPKVVEVIPESVKPLELKQESSDSAVTEIKKELSPLSDTKTKPEKLSSVNSGMYIQLGIFTDIEKIKPLQQKLNLLGIPTKSETIKINGEDKVRLITDEFRSEALARETLMKIRNVGVIGIIKKVN